VDFCRLEISLLKVKGHVREPFARNQKGPRRFRLDRVETLRQAERLVSIQFPGRACRWRLGEVPGGFGRPARRVLLLTEGRL